MSQNFQPPAPDSFTEAPAPAPARTGNIGLGIAAAVVAALVAAAIYGAIIGSTKHEIGYAAVGVGIIVGFAAGKLGGSNPVLPVVSAVLAIGAVVAGQLLGTAIIGADVLNSSVMDLLTNGFDLVQASWKEDLDPMSFLFFAIGAVLAFQTARKTAA
ncbi:hypothetical protein ACIGFK_31890 [Streptomyces sp. NPDC085524]|uniref:hypothetical protein n=1 Tax=unclassified Streptomyces TaxID=2593676 RepID=UPI0035E27171